MKHPTTIVRKPLITEKATFGAGEANRYAFHVDNRATKPQIKKAVEELYGVRVLGVATQTRVGRVRRVKYGYVKSAPTKRAVVKIHPDDRIELF